MFDVIVIGAGPAGISSALYAKRANLSVIVLYHGESQLEKAHKIDNYYGFENGISGKDLYNSGIEQAKNLGIEVKDSEVTNIQIASESSYTVSSSTGEYECKALIIATGNKKLRPAIKNIEQFEGKGISYCAVCDGFFYRKKDVAVIGDKKYAFEEAKHLSHIASSVTILTNGKDSSLINSLIQNDAEIAKEKVSVCEKIITSVNGEEAVSSVSFEDKSEMCVSGVFIALGEAGAADFAKKLGVTLKGDAILTDENMMTNAPGIFSCGNATGGLLQVCKAVYEGALAGLGAVKYVRSLAV